MWVLGVLQKSFPKKFIKKYLCYRLFLMLLKSFRLSGLQLYWRDTPALVFQNKPFVDFLQNRCSWIIHKTHRKALLCWSYFFKNTFFYRTSPVAAPESFSFPACNFIIKATTAKFFFSKFSKIFKDIFSFDRTPQDDCFLCLPVNLSFSEYFFYSAAPENCYFLYKLKNFNHQMQ